MKHIKLNLDYTPLPNKRDIHVCRHYELFFTNGKFHFA